MGNWIISSVVSIVLVVVIRGIFWKKISARTMYALWLLVMVRLICPLNFGRLPISMFNFLPRWQTDLFREEEPAVLDSKDMEAPALDSEDMGAGIYEAKREEAAQPGWQQESGSIFMENATDRADRLEEAPVGNVGDGAKNAAPAVKTVHTEKEIARILRRIWAVGAVAAALTMLAFNIGFWARLRRSRKVLDADRKGVAVYEVQWLSTPCLFGIVRPAIYLNTDALSEEKRAYCIAHEYSHYLQKDHIWSLIRSVCLILHWYDPFVYLAVYLSKRDGELACDERTVAGLGEDERFSYGHVLLKMSSKEIDEGRQKRKLILLGTVTTMSFGKREMRLRIRAIAERRKTGAAAFALASVITLFAVPVIFTGAQKRIFADEAMQPGLAELGKEECLAQPVGTVFGEMEVIGREDAVWCNLPENVKSWENMLPICRDPKYGIVYYVNFGRDYKIYAIRDGKAQIAVPIMGKRLFCRDGKLIFLAGEELASGSVRIEKGNVLQYDPVSGKVEVLIGDEFASVTVYQDMICCRKNGEAVGSDGRVSETIDDYFYMFDSGELIRAENNIWNPQRCGEDFLYPVYGNGVIGSTYRAVATELGTWDQESRKRIDKVFYEQFYIKDGVIYYPDFNGNRFCSYHVDSDQEEVLEIVGPDGLQPKLTASYIVLDGRIYDSNCSIVSLDTGEWTECFSDRLGGEPEWTLKEMYTDGENVYALAAQGIGAPKLLKVQVIPFSERVYDSWIHDPYDYQYVFSFSDPAAVS